MFFFLFIYRLFSCGTSKEGESYIVEWNESEGSVKRTYVGFRKRSMGGVVQFDTTKNRFLAAGEEFMVKFWDMDNINLLTTTDAGGELPVIYFMCFPFLFFNNLTLKKLISCILISYISRPPHASDLTNLVHF